MLTMPSSISPAFRSAGNIGSAWPSQHRNMLVPEQSEGECLEMPTGEQD
jgi:hypothetical protein